MTAGRTNHTRFASAPGAGQICYDGAVCDIYPCIRCPFRKADVLESERELLALIFPGKPEDWADIID